MNGEEKVRMLVRRRKTGSYYTYQNTARKHSAVQDLSEILSLPEQLVTQMKPITHPPDVRMTNTPARRSEVLGGGVENAVGTHPKGSNTCGRARVASTPIFTPGLYHRIGPFPVQAFNGAKASPCLSSAADLVLHNWN